MPKANTETSSASSRQRDEMIPPMLVPPTAHSHSFSRSSQGFGHDDVSSRRNQIVEEMRRLTEELVDLEKKADDAHHHNGSTSAATSVERTASTSHMFLAPRRESFGGHRKRSMAVGLLNQRRIVEASTVSAAADDPFSSSGRAGEAPGGDGPASPVVPKVRKSRLVTFSTTTALATGAPEDKTKEGSVMSDQHRASVASTDKPDDSSGDGKAQGQGSTGGQSAKEKKYGVLDSTPVVAICDIVYVCSTFALLAMIVAGLLIEEPNTTALAVGIALCQIVALGWMSLRFFVQTRSGTWDIVADLPEIRKQYRRSWFAFDLVCALPIDFVFIAWSWNAFFFVQLRQFVRIVRLFTLGSSGNPLRESRKWMQLCIMFGGFVFVVHVTACAFIGIDEDRSYTDALFWAVATISSVGYSDVGAAKVETRPYTMICMFIGVFMVATLTAFATSFLTKRDALQESITEKKQMLASMLDYFNVPWDEQIEIISLFPTALNAANEKQFTELVQSMPPFIVERIEGYTKARALSSSIPLFAELSVAVVLELTSKLRQRFCPGNDPIISHGEEGYEMYFLVRGIADVIVPISETEEVVVAVLRSGSFFGEMALIQDTKRTASVIAVVMCELLCLAKPDFVEMTDRHDVLRDIFLKEVFKRHNVQSLVKAAETEELEESEGVSEGEEHDDAKPAVGEGSGKPSVRFRQDSTSNPLEFPEEQQPDDGPLFNDISGLAASS